MTPPAAGETLGEEEELDDDEVVEAEVAVSATGVDLERRCESANDFKTTRTRSGDLLGVERSIGACEEVLDVIRILDQQEIRTLV
jgi:hypothetical protein